MAKLYIKKNIVSNGASNNTNFLFLTLFLETPGSQKLGILLLPLTILVLSFPPSIADPDKSSLDRIEDAIAKLAASQIHVTEKLEDLLLQVTNLEHTTNSTHSPLSSSAKPASNNTIINPHKMKLDVPRFDGFDPSGWIFKITQFFVYHSTP